MIPKLESTNSILFTPLNWGLGHASRSLNLIKFYINKGKKIGIASDGDAYFFLKESLQNEVGIDFYSLPELNINYGNGHFLSQSILEGRKLIHSISQDKTAIDLLISKHHFDVIISDHRLGCYHETCTNIIVCHQLNIPIKNIILSNLINKVHHRYLKKFNEVWIPDLDNKLSGIMSKSKIKMVTKNIGAISHLKKTKSKIEFDIAVIISGPEPSRTQFELKILNTLNNNSLKKIIIRGTSKPSLHAVNEFDEVIDIAHSTKVESVINQSNIIISRMGYSTLMDLYSLDKKAILIPTKNQPEQEYLGEYHASSTVWKVLKESQIESKLMESIHQLLN